MDLDEVLDFEKHCFDAGHNEGLEVGRTQGHTEGRELGIQTGFLRYMPVGILQSRAEAWATGNPAGGDPSKVSQLQQLVDIQSLENDSETVDDVDHRTKLAKNKARLLAAQTRAPSVVAHDQKIAHQRDDAIEDI